MRILVVGATGAQGGGVARHLLRRPQFTVRALTRSPGSPAARQLRHLGAQVVEGDLANRATIRAALKDCHGVFGLTSYAEHLDREQVLGMNLVNAVAGSAIEHFVLSALPPIERLTHGVYRSRQCQIKARLESYARSLQLPATYLHPAPYFETLPAIVARRAARCGPAGHTGHGPDQSPPEQPARELPAIAAGDIGGIVAAIFAQPDRLFDRTVAAIGDRRPLDHYARLMAEADHNRPAAGGVANPQLETVALDDLMPLVDFLTGRAVERDELEEDRALHPEMHSYPAWLRLTPRRHDGAPAVQTPMITTTFGG